MKIGITTFQWADNYGALIQAHALQTFLQARGHEVQIVDYRPETGASRVRRWLSASPRGCVRKWEANWKKLLFERFRKKQLVRTPEVFRSASELRKIADRFDLLIAGSDQVWNPKWLSQFDGLFALYFLSFAGVKTKRISYAASIGHSSRDTMMDEWVAVMREKLLEMDSISMREASGVGLIDDLCGRTDAVQVCDPTLLLDRPHYDALAGPAADRGKYLFNFMLHGLERDAAPVCRQIAGANGWNVLKCDVRRTALHRGWSLPSPEGWLRQIRDAEFVVTNSFHCTVFCLIFHVPFIAVLIDGQIGSMNARIVDFLDAVGLQDRILPPKGEFSAGMRDMEIPWKDVDHRISGMRESAIQFLIEQEI